MQPYLYPNREGGQKIEASGYSVVYYQSSGRRGREVRCACRAGRCGRYAGRGGKKNMQQQQESAVSHMTQMVGQEGGKVSPLR